MIDPQYFGLIEMGFFFAVFLGFICWQFWTVRHAGKARPNEDGSKSARISEGHHEPDER
jgi:hypothetical protein